MNLKNLKIRVRSITRDFTNTIYRDQDIVDYINEAIDRSIEIFPELSKMVYLSADTDEPLLLPRQYHYLLALYSASRLQFQDENFYQSVNLMNEFEAKMAEFLNFVENGKIVITDPDTGQPISLTNTTSYVKDNYYIIPHNNTDANQTLSDDVDLGVEGVE